jgi:hypothetical protein
MTLLMGYFLTKVNKSRLRVPAETTRHKHPPVPSHLAKTSSGVILLL